MLPFASSPNGDRSTSTDPAAREAERLERALLAHDLRGGLNGVMGGLAMVDLDTLPFDAREQIERARAAAETVSYLLFVALGEIDESVGALLGVDLGSVDVSALLDFHRRRWSAEAREKGLSLRVVVEADAPTRAAVPLPPTCRIIGNFVGNAIRHCARGGVELVASGTREGGLLLRVSDTGAGMSAEALARARAGILPEDFDPETTTHGLGLHVARALAGRIGATLSLRNRESGGFEAAIELPREVCSRAAPRPPEAESDLAGARILLAEDNPTNQMVATQMLRALRAEVTVTSDGAEALEAFAAGAFDLVVLDIEMPRVSGLDVIRRIRGRGDARASVPIVALTAYAMREHQERIAKAGANGLISKPISGIEAFGRALAAHLPPRRRPEPAPSRAGAAPIVDATIYAALAKAIGPELMAELIEKVVLDLSAAGAELAAARAPLDLPAIRSASHILISVAGAIGAVGLQSRARTLNALAHGAEPPEEPVAACLAEIDAVLAFLADRPGAEGMA